MGIELASDRWIRRYRIKGLPIVRIFPGLPADDAGMVGAYRNSRGEITLGDIIIGIDDQPIRNNDDYLSLMENRKVGDVVTVRTRRGGEEREFEVALIESQ